MNCIECGKSSKYKCPTCRQPYCSVPCCKIHKSTLCSAPLLPPKSNITEESSVHYEFPTEDTIPYEKLQQLEQSPELKNCLKDPFVRDLLKTLDTSPNPDTLIEEYMQESEFRDFVDACLRVVQPQENSHYG